MWPLPEKHPRHYMQTDRTYLTLISEADFPDFLAMFQEPDTFQYIPRLQNQTESEYRRFLESRIQLVQSGQGYYWAARSLKDHSFIGALNLYPFTSPEIIHLGCQIRRQYWHQGYATEMMRWGRDFGIYEWGLPLIYAFADVRHTVSVHLLKKLGFVRTEVRQEESGEKTAIFLYRRPEVI